MKPRTPEEIKRDETVAEIHAQIDAEVLKDQREAVQAWLKSPDFPRGAGALVFEAAGQSVTNLDNPDGLVGNVADHALHLLTQGDDGARYYVLQATSIALAHLGTVDELPANIEAFMRFYNAAFDYCTTHDKRSARLRIRTKKIFRPYLLEQVREISNSVEDKDARLVIAAKALLTGVMLFPSLGVYNGRRAAVDVMCERLAKFDMSRFAEPIPPPGEGTADGGKAADIAFALLRCAGVPYNPVYNFIHGAERQKTKRAREAAAPAGTTTPPKQSRRRP